MLPDDTFRVELEHTVRAVEAWCRGLADVATFESETADSFWRMRCRPKAPSACPVEVIVRRSQVWDLDIGPETYETMAGQPLATLMPLLDAIAAGRVITRTVRSPVTGRPLSVHTIIAPGEPGEWQRARTIDEAPAGTATVHQDRRYVPYRQA